MSWWSARTKEPAKVSDLHEDDFEFAPQVDHATDESREQFQEAVRVTRHLLDSGLWGGVDKEFRVTFSGHANPNHEPSSGWVNDCITITVSQVFAD